MAFIGPRVSASTESELQSIFNINLFALVALTREFLPLLKKSEAGRIVNLGSILGSLTFQAMEPSPIAQLSKFPYNASKAALNMFTIHLAAELKDTNIKVNSVDPGWVKTALVRTRRRCLCPTEPKPQWRLRCLDRIAPTAALSTKSTRSCPGKTFRVVSGQKDLRIGGASHLEVS
jgi:NAD(P)-dependent dehydrogenase (short-subunit alcohol dehydrogenase family)